MESGKPGTSSRDNSIPKSEVLAKWAAFEKIVTDWEKSDSAELFFMFRGRHTKAISEAIVQGFAEVATFIDTDNFAPDAWQTVLAIDEVFDAFDAWGRAMENHPEDCDPHGTRELWFKYHSVREAAKPVVYNNVESVHQLAAMPNMPPAQIAKIYGWYDELGNPDVGKVSEELENPGKHTKNWVNPIVKRKNDELLAKWRIRTDRIDERKFSGPKKREQKIEEKRKLGPAPESVEELLKMPHMTVEQVALMKQISVDDVRQIAANARIAIDHHVAEMMRNASASKIPGLQKMVDSQTVADISSIYTYPQLSTMEERIDAMLDDRIKPGMIAAALKESFPAISYQTVVNRADERRAERSAKRNALRGSAATSERPEPKDKPRTTTKASKTA